VVGWEEVAEPGEKWTDLLEKKGHGDEGKMRQKLVVNKKAQL